MSDTQVQPGGNRIPDSTRVSVDGTTIFGDGSSENPLNAPGGGGGSVHTNGTLTGNGTLGTPLGVNTGALAGDIAVATDGTLTGNGTTGSPLHVVGGAVTVVADGVTIVGDGSIGDPLAVDPDGLAGEVAVATDGTLTGDGTSGSPLHVVGGSSPNTFQAKFVGFGDPILGQAVTISPSSPTPAITAVTPVSLSAVETDGGTIAGVIISDDGGGLVTVQTSGLVTLTAPQWNLAMGGGSGGLAPSETYYVSTAGGGELDDVAPVSLGAYAFPVGIALNSTVLSLLTPAVAVGPHAATANVNGGASGGGLIASRGFGTFTRTGTGRYTLALLGSPPADIDCIVQVTLTTNFSVAVVASATVASGIVEVFISQETGGAGIDGNFYVTVTVN